MHDFAQLSTDNMLSSLNAELSTIDQHPALIFDLVNQIVLPHFDY